MTIATAFSTVLARHADARPEELQNVGLAATWTYAFLSSPWLSQTHSIFTGNGTELWVMKLPTGAVI